ARPGLLVEELHEHRGRAAREPHDRAPARAPGDQLRRGRTAEPRLERAAQLDRVAEQTCGGQARGGARHQVDGVVAVPHPPARRPGGGRTGPGPPPAGRRLPSVGAPSVATPPTRRANPAPPSAVTAVPPRPRPPPRRGSRHTGPASRRAGSGTAP